MILLISSFLVTDDVLLDGYVAADKVGRYAKRFSPDCGRVL